MIFSLTSSAIPPTAKVAGFRGVERISTPYQFDVYFTIDTLPGIPLTFDLADAVFAKAKLSVKLGTTEEFSFSGLLASVRLVRAAESTALFHARLVPQIWQLLLTKHSRIWTKKSSVDVLKEVLDEAGIDYEIRLQSSYEVEEQVTQYKESNLTFISRWMEREGMYYYFEQGDDGDLLVITDNKSVHESQRQDPVKYYPQSDYQDVMAKQAFDNFAATHNALPASVKLIDYDYARPLLDVSASVSVASNAVGEIAEYGGRFFSPADAQRLAQTRAEEFLTNKDTFEATGAATSLVAGYTFTLEDHPLGQYNKEYLITGIEHHGYDAQFGPAWGSLIQAKYKDVYRVELKCIDREVQYRHGQEHPWPRVDGYENAIVDGPANSQYAQIDDQGRYNIKFKFDEGTFKDGKGTTHVRMAQPHGGPAEGHHFPLRKNVEVICSFLGGDPDRPVIVGVVHNMVNQSVVTQNNHTQNIIRTGSLNHIVMEDLSGSMFIDVWCPIFSSTLFLGHGEWNFNLTTQGCGQIQTILNLNIDVDQWWTVDVVNYVTWDFHDKHTWNNNLEVSWTFSNTFTWEVTLAVDIDWLATLDLYVKGAAKIKFDATLDVDVTGNVTTKIGGNNEYTLKGSDTTKIAKHQDFTIEAGGQTVDITGNQKITVNGNQEVHITGSQKVTVDSPEETHFLGTRLKVTHGAETNLFYGLKNNVNFAILNDLTVSAGFGINVGAKFSAKLAAEFAINVGVFMELALALKMSYTAISIGLTGISVGVQGVSISASALKMDNKTLKFESGGLDTAVKALILKI